MNIRTVHFTLITLLVLLAGCRQEVKMKGGFDLMKFDIPVTLQAPEGVTATQQGKGSTVDVRVTDSKGYDIQVFMFDGTTSDLKSLVSQKKEIAASHPDVWLKPSSRRRASKACWSIGKPLYSG